MAIKVVEGSVAAESIGRNAKRESLLNGERIPGIKFRLDRVFLDAGGSLDLRIPANDLAWFQVLEGQVELVHGEARQRLSDAHVAFLPPGFDGRLRTDTKASVLLASVPEIAQLDSEAATKPLDLRLVDWTREPVLLSQHDARKRIYLVTPKLFNTKAIKGEMIIYPPGTEAANHHHEGAAHFMYILAGGGTCYANEQPFPVRKGDVVYYADGERHYLRSDPDVEMRFVEFFIPGQYKTVWAPGANVCTWSPTGSNIRGEKAARQVQAHSSAAPTADI